MWLPTAQQAGASSATGIQCIAESSLVAFAVAGVQLYIVQDVGGKWDEQFRCEIVTVARLRMILYGAAHTQHNDGAGKLTPRAICVLYWSHECD
jgi:hypothetical protein